MPKINVFSALQRAELDDTTEQKLTAALTAFASSPDDVWVAAGFCFDALAVSLEYCIRTDLPVEDRIESVLLSIDGSNEDFGRPDDLACDFAALLYAPVQLVTAHFDLTPPPRMREAISYAFARVFHRDADLLPFQAWTLACSLNEAVQVESADDATTCVADLRAFALSPPRDDEDPRYRHEPDQDFLNPGCEEDADPLPDDFEVEIISSSDLAIPLERVLLPADDARCRLGRLVARQRALCRPGASDDATLALLAERIDYTRNFIDHTDKINDTIRRGRAMLLN